ncbi:hypothetical protein L0222_19825 [bacterium]|nr:hypothetical protein [bacterium]MCI0601559.1 hypothetical protein [bacterium]
MKTALILLLLLQAFALAGPVCGNHLTTAESMDCCEKGHSHDTAGMRDDHATACCSSCNTGKTQILKQQGPVHPVIVPATEIVSVEISNDLPWWIDSFDPSISPSPPIFLLDRSLRI